MVEQNENKLIISPRCRRIGLATACIVTLGIVVGFIILWTTFPDDIPVVDSQASESIPSLVAAGTINEFDGFVRIDSTFDLDDPSTINYYLTVDGVESYPNGNNDDNDIALVLTTFRSATDLLVESDEDAIIVRNVASALDEEDDDDEDDEDSETMLFPFLLPQNYIPQNYPTAVFVIENEDQSGVDAIIGIVDLKNGNGELLGADDGETDNGNGGVAETEIAEANGTEDSVGNEENDIENETVMNDESETNESVTSENSNGGGGGGDSDVSGLTSTLDGSRYSISGTIAVEFRTDFVNGEFQSIPTLKFDSITPPSAPGPFLYLSTRSLDETRSTGPNFDEDLFIPIDEAADGSFTVRGTFFQDLDELADGASISDYNNGSWIVWCDPFRVYLGGGQISVVEQ